MNTKNILSVLLFAGLITVIGLQAKYILAEDENSPLSAPISGVETPISTPIENPISAPVDETPISTPVETPISAPVDETPISAPIASPTPSPSPVPEQPISTPTVPVTAPISVPVTVSGTNIGSILGTAIALGEDAVGTITTLLNVLTQTTIEVVSGGQTNSVVLPSGTLITKTDGTSYDASTIAASVVSNSSIIAPSSTTTISVLQWGIPNTGLQFSQAITVNIYVGSSYNGQTLSIFRSVSGNSNWTTDGLTSSTCVVANAICSFQTTKASYFTVGQLNITTTTSSTTNSSGSTSSSNPASCDSAKPGSAPVLLSAKVVGKNEIMLVWSEAKGPVTYYLVAYGTKSGELIYGNPNVGGADTRSTIVKGLSGNTKYYFRVRAGNACTPGDFSNEVSVLTSGITLDKPAVGYTEGVLGKSKVIHNVQKEIAQEAPVVNNTVSENKPNFVEKIINFFKSIFSK